MSLRAALLWVLVLLGGWMFLPWLAGSTGPFGNLKASTIASRAMFPALSPDGKTVAISRDNLQGHGLDSEVVYTTIDVRDARSSNILGTFSLPTTRTGGMGNEEWRNDFHMQYCDRGKYIVLSDSQNLMYVVDARTLQIHTTFDLRSMAALSEGPIPRNGIDEIVGSCSANGGTAVFFLRGGRFGKDGFVRVVDLETGERMRGIESLDTAGAGWVNISPSGNLVAFLERENNHGDQQHDGQIVVFDIRANAVYRRIPVSHRGYKLDEGLLFAGDSAMILEQRSPTENTNVRNWSFQLVDLTKGQVAGLFGDQQDEDMAVSADGRTVMGSLPRRSFGRGAKFILWDRESGKSIAESPDLGNVHHGCFLAITFIGNCSASDETPMLELSQDGHSVLAWWSQSDGHPKVYSLR
jgi:WD40-like Beta Propeller Repeat